MDSETADHELASRIAAGGGAARAAEEELCRRFAPRIRLYGLRHLRDAARADDLVQSVLLAVLQAARSGGIADLDKVDRFVLGTCRNQALRMRERDGRVSAMRLEELPELALEPRETIDLGGLMRCFDGLDARAKEVVRLSFTEERSAEEIAAHLSISAGNVRVLRHRALSSLRQCLDNGARRPT